MPVAAATTLSPMCLEFPGCVIALDGDVVTVRTASTTAVPWPFCFPSWHSVTG